MKLDNFIQNPDNPSKATDEQIARLSGKLKRVPKGLTVMRIAYVTDVVPGKKMVISGNKRLQVLKEIYGDGKDLPDEWFEDVTCMSEAERHEFIVTANVSDGDWDLDKLLAQYDKSEFEDLGISDLLLKLPSTDINDLDSYFEEVDNVGEKKPKTAKCPKCGEVFEI